MIYRNHKITQNLTPNVISHLFVSECTLKKNQSTVMIMKLTFSE